MLRPNGNQASVRWLAQSFLICPADGDLQYFASMIRGEVSSWDEWHNKPLLIEGRNTEDIDNYQDQADRAETKRQVSGQQRLG